ncbi:MAG: LysR family transcriptional regulator [Lachnospiraceae bacterium]
MTIETIETFLLLCEYRNFTKTANKLFIAQSTVTNRIAELEKEIGKPLLKRNNKSMELTAHGKIYHDYAKRIIQLHNSAVLTINQDNDFYKKKIHIGTTNTIYECHLKEKVLSYVSQKTNDIMLKITINHSNELLDMLSMDFIDYVYIYIPYKKPGFICDCFSVDELVLVCSYHEQMYSQGITKEQLPSLRYIYCNFALQEVGIFIRELFPKHYQFHFEIDNSTKVLEYILAGAGYSFLPLSLVKEHVDNKQLRLIPLLDFESPKINNYVIYKENLLGKPQIFITP